MMRLGSNSESNEDVSTLLLVTRRTSTRIRADSESSPLPELQSPMRPSDDDASLLSYADNNDDDSSASGCINLTDLTRTRTRIRTDSESSPLPVLAPPRRRPNAADSDEEDIQAGIERTAATSVTAASVLANDKSQVARSLNRGAPSSSVKNNTGDNHDDGPELKKQRQGDDVSKAAGLKYANDREWSDGEEDDKIEEEDLANKQKSKKLWAVAGGVVLAAGAIGMLTAKALTNDDDFDDGGGGLNDGGGGGVTGTEGGAPVDISQAATVDISQAANVVPGGAPVDISQAAIVAPPAPQPAPIMPPGQMQIITQMATQAA